MTLARPIHANALGSVEISEREITRLLLEALPCGALLIDTEGRISAVNQQAEIILGWAPPALEEQPAHDLLRCYAEDNVDLPDNCPISRILRGENVAPAARMWVRCRGDSRKPIEYRCTPYPTGKGLGAILAFSDITRHLELEKDLRALASIA